MAGGFLRELAVRLGIVVDEKSVAKADNAVESLIDKAKELAKEWLAFEGAKKLYEFTEQMAESAEQVSISAATLGIGVEEYQKLGYAAERTGISNDELRQSLFFLERAADESKKGVSEQSKAFASLGIRATDAAGRVKPMAELLPELSAAFVKMDDPAKKAHLAMELFGRAGARMVPFLNKGPEAMAALGAEAEELGAVMSEDDISAFEKFAHAWSGVFDGLKKAIALPLAKSFTKIADSIRDWMKANGGLMQQRIGDFFTAIGKGVEYAVRLVEPFTDLIMTLVGAALDASPALTAVAAAAALIAGVFSFSALGLVLFGLTLALVVEDIYSYFQGKDSVTGLVVRSINDMWVAFTAPRSEEFSLMKVLRGSAVAIADLLHTAIIDPLDRVFQMLAALASGDFKSAFNVSKEFARKAADAVTQGGSEQLINGFATAKGLFKRTNPASDYDPHAGQPNASLQPDNSSGEQVTSYPGIPSRDDRHAVNDGRSASSAASAMSEASSPVPSLAAVMPEVSSQAPQVQSTFSPTVNIHATTGASADDIASSVRKSLQEFHDEQWRQTRDALVPSMR